MQKMCKKNLVECRILGFMQMQIQVKIMLQNVENSVKKVVECRTFGSFVDVDFCQYDSRCHRSWPKKIAPAFGRQSLNTLCSSLGTRCGQPDAQHHGSDFPLLLCWEGSDLIMQGYIRTKIPIILLSQLDLASSLDFTPIRTCTIHFVKTTLSHYLFCISCFKF